MSKEKREPPSPEDVIPAEILEHNQAEKDEIYKWKADIERRLERLEVQVEVVTRHQRRER